MKQEKITCFKIVTLLLAITTALVPSPAVAQNSSFLDQLRTSRPAENEIEEFIKALPGLRNTRDSEQLSAPTGSDSRFLILTADDGKSTGQTINARGESLKQAYLTALKKCSECASGSSLRIDILTGSLTGQEQPLAVQRVGQISQTKGPGLLLPEQMRWNPLNRRALQHFSKTSKQKAGNSRNSRFPGIFRNLFGVKSYILKNGSVAEYPKTPDDFTLSKKLLLQRIKLASEYLSRAVKQDGSFVYLYLPTSAKEGPGYNILRHAGSLWSLVQGYRLHPKQEILESIKRAKSYLIEQLQPCPEQKEGENLLCLVEGGYTKLGGNGLALLALTEFEQATNEKVDREVLEGIADWMLSIQQKSGRFHTHKYSIRNKKKAPFRSNYYPGEAAFGLMGMYNLTKQKKYFEAAKNSVIYRSSRSKNIPDNRLEHDHWLLYAIEQVLKVEKQNLLIEHARRLIDVITRLQNKKGEAPESWVGGYHSSPGSTPAATRSEGLMAAYRLFKRVGDDHYAQKALEAAKLGIQFQLTLQVTEADTLFFKDREFPLGGFKKDLTNSEIRNDYVQHSLSSLFSLYEEMS